VIEFAASIPHLTTPADTVGVGGFVLPVGAGVVAVAAVAVGEPEPALLAGGGAWDRIT
jgi:hypothetical protein